MDLKVKELIFNALYPYYRRNMDTHEHMGFRQMQPS